MMKLAKTLLVGLFFSFQLAAKDAPTIRFAVIGDFGVAGPEEEAVAKIVHGLKPEFIITTGDNNYPHGSAKTIDANIGQYYHDFIGAYHGIFKSGAAQNEFFPALGNHDWDTSGAKAYTDYFELPGNERYYDFVRGPVHFFILDSDPREPDGRGPESKQAQWFEKAIKTSRSQFRVVVFHHPAFSSGTHGSDPVMQWDFKKMGVDVVLSGHDHIYERLLIGGVVYFVNGVGGNEIYAIKSKPEKGSQFRYTAEHGAMFATANNRELSFKFVNIKSEEVDSYKISRLPKALSHKGADAL